MSARTKRQKSSETYRFLCGTCPDEECKARLYFPSYDKSVECTGCGQRHEKSLLRDVAEVTNPEVAIHNLLKNILLGNRKPKKGADNVKVLGLSNYLCKLISPILTSYGMDRKTGKARLLKEMGQDEVLNCGKILGNRAFLIEEENLDVIGYGRDRSGSLQYLADTLQDIKAFNNNETRLVPIHADGDGHCLVHAISRALVGRELFWHALRVNLGQHLRDNLDKYKMLFQNFVDSNEWDDIIDECDPYYIPPEGEPIGLRNIHIFGLANILHRPIILLDSKSGMQSFGDYSGVFLPGFVKPQDCRSKEGVLNKPLCIAWSSSGRNHYIPLVGVKGTGETYLPSYMVQKAWGMPKEEIKKYIEFDHLYRCTIGGDKCLTDKYLRQLVGAMEEIFMEQYHVHPSLVADVHQFIYKSSGIVGVQPPEVIERTQKCVSDKLLYRCLTCDALMEYHLSMEQFEKGGALYNLAVNTHKKLDPTKMYSFPTYGAVCSYDKDKDILVPDKEKSQPNSCVFCNGQLLRRVKADGSIQYINGDRTTTPSVGGKCVCGYKHYWNGEEFDNLPEQLPISLQWAGKLISESVAWFQYETDPTKNSNVFEVAQKLVQKHFPGEFGSERLVQRVVDTILAQTAVASREDNKMEEGEPSDAWSSEQASKIILTGHKHKTLHKEELTMSEKEKGVRKKIQTHAPQVQQKKTLEIQAQKTKVSEPVETEKSEKEKGVRKKIQTHAPQVQQKKTLEIQAQKTKVSTPVETAVSEKEKGEKKKIQTQAPQVQQKKTLEIQVQKTKVSEPVETAKSEKEKGVRKKNQTHAPQVQQKKTLEIQAQKTKVREPVETAKSEKEKGVRKKIQTHAPQIQQKKTLEIQTQKTKVSEPVETAKSEKEKGVIKKIQTHAPQVQQKKTLERDAQKTKVSEPVETAKSEKEKGVRKKIQTHAPQVQQKKTLEIHAQKTKVSEPVETAKSEKEKGVRKKIQTHAPQVQQKKTLEIQAQKTKVSEPVETAKSEKEKGVRKKIQTHAPQVQQKKTLEIHAQKTKVSEPVETAKSEKEKGVRKKIQTHAPQVQQKKTLEIQTQKTKVSEPVETAKSEKEKGVRKKIQIHAPQVQQKKTLEIQAQKTKSTATKEIKSSQSKPHTEVPSSSQSSSGTSQPSTSSSEKKIRLATSDGRQAMLTLVSDVTFFELQKLIYQAVDVSADRQKIRMGFPPKILEPPGEGEEDIAIALQHGDKIALEILPDPNEMQQCVGAANAATSSNHSPTHNVLKQTGWNSFDENIAQNQSAETLLKALKNVQQTGDSIDTSIASMTILCAVTGKDLWTYVQGMPHLFSVGGLLYNQVQRDLGLTEGKHCQLPCLPGKVFRYSSKEDRLELCLEPYGHFPIEPNIEQKVMDSNVEEAHEGSEVKFGASGAVRHGAEHRAFQGQGHSLKAAETRMPTDLACADRRPHARGFRDLCVPGHHEDSIKEEAEGDQMEAETSQETNPSSSYQRLGPGFSVLDPVAANTTNSNVEMFRALAESIEKTLSEDVEEEEISDVDTHIPPMGLFESIMATQSKQTVTMETADTGQSDLSDKQTLTMDTQEDTGTNEICENTVEVVSIDTAATVQSNETDKNTLPEQTADATMEATETLETVMPDQTISETISDMDRNKDVLMDRTEAVVDKNVVIDTENVDLDKNQTNTVCANNNVVEMSKDEGDVNTGSAIDKTVSEVTMEIVEETLNTMEKTDKITEGDVEETVQIDLERPASARSCDDTDSKETLAVSDNQSKDEPKSVEKDAKMEVENKSESETSTH